MKKVISLMVLLAFALSTEAFAQARGGKDRKEGKSREQQRLELERINKGNAGLRSGGNTEASVKAQEVTNNVFRDNSFLSAKDATALKTVKDNFSVAVSTKLIRSETALKARDVLDSSSSTAEQKELATAVLSEYAALALKNQLTANNIVLNVGGKTGTVNQASFSDGLILDLLSGKETQADINKVRDFIRDRTERINNGESYEQASKGALEKIGRSWEDFVKNCLKV